MIFNNQGVCMKYYDDILEAIGHTPLVKLRKVGRDLPVTLLAKAEYLNPGGSVKDRIGLAMIEDEKRGILNKDTVIIEPTSGNTGIAFVAAAKVGG